MNTKNFLELVEEYNYLNQQKLEFSKKLDKIKKLMDERLTESGFDSFDFGYVKVSRWTKEYVSYPKSMLIENVPEELLKKCQKIIKSGGIKVTIRKEK